MSLRVVPFRVEHIDEAAALAAAHVLALREAVPLIPQHWTEPASFTDLLGGLIERGPAVVALQDGRVAAYLGAFPWERGGVRNVHSPEWASVCTGVQARRLREELYSAMAGTWLADGRVGHFIGLLPSDRVGFETLQWLGFGHSNVDGLRSLDPVIGGAAVGVRPARPADAEAVLQLEAGLRQHLASTPLFLSLEPLPTVDEVAHSLDDDERVTLLSIDQHGPLAHLRIGPASDDASTIIRDEGTASITGAFTRADRRGHGVAAALLNAALAWARERGYVRCAVDHESANLLASRFWPRHFEVVGLTLRRRI